VSFATPASPSIPPEVLQVVREIFAGCNDEVAGLLSEQPLTHEPWLDSEFLGYLRRKGKALVVFDSGWIVDIEPQIIAGPGQYYKWEIADIGVLVRLRKGTKLMWSKVALLQAKRLYPVNAPKRTEEEFERALRGFISLHDERADELASQRRQSFRFSFKSKYRDLDLKDQQASRIDLYEQENNIPVYYLLYNPVTVPWSRSSPAYPGDPPPRLSRLTSTRGSLPFIISLTTRGTCTGETLLIDSTSLADSRR
jgi:hypothetical protein